MGRGRDQSIRFWWRSGSRWGSTVPEPDPGIFLKNSLFTIVDFKVATLVHGPLSGNSASYLADDCRIVADARERRLRSTESRTCVRYPDSQHLW